MTQSNDLLSITTRIPAFLVMAAVSGSVSLAGVAAGDEVHCGVHERIVTKGTVTAPDHDGPLTLRPEEQVALMFLLSIKSIEFWCVQQEERACTLDELIASDRMADGTRVGCLKYGPAEDSNYSYSLTVSDKSWDARAKARKKGLASFHFQSSGNPYFLQTFYRPRGAIGPVEKEITEYGGSGESFVLP